MDLTEQRCRPVVASAEGSSFPPYAGNSATPCRPRPFSWPEAVFGYFFCISRMYDTIILIWSGVTPLV